MSFMGADTDELREAGQKCQEGKESTDEVITYLRALIIVLRAAGFFTGGASAAYAEYLETTVVPWLQRISQALGLMAQVLMSNAQAQDDVSDGRTVDFSSLPTYTSLRTGMPSQPISCWQGTLVPEQGSSFSPAPTSPDTGAGTVPQSDPGGTTAGSVTAPAGTPDSIGTPGSIGTPVSPGADFATRGHVGALSDHAIGSSAGIGGIGGEGSTSGSWGLSTSDGTGGTSGSTGGAIDGTGGSPGGAGSSGSGGFGASSIGSGTGSGADAAPGSGELTSYSTDGASLGGATPDSGAPHGDAGLSSGVTTAPTAEQGSYGSASVIAGGAAAAGLAGAGLASRASTSESGRIDELGVQNRRGSRGEDVRELQERLTSAGYDTRGADGSWGPNTQAAYEAYRQDHPLEIRHGEGFTAPSGFDYQQITGVRNNPNVTPEFLREVEGVAQRIGAKPEHLMGVMSFETGGDFGADTPTGARNGTAVGLIQFTGVARQDLGVSRDQLMAMTPTEQLQYVERYFDSRRGPHLGTVEGLYSAVLGGTGSTDMDRVQISVGDPGWEGNKNLDTDHSGGVTVREGAARVQRALSGR